MQDDSAPFDGSTARADLAAALRWAARLDLHEGIDNHFSLAVTAAGDRFLINPYGPHWSEITAADLLLVDADGTTLEGEGRLDRTAFWIHSRLHLGRPAARCILHTHMPYATALASVEGGRIEPIHQNALRFHGRVSYDDTFNGLVHDGDEGDWIRHAMGDNPVLFMANHGVIVAGATVAEAFDTLYYLERACRNQVLAMATGLKLKRVPAAVVERTAAQMGGSGESARTHFAALKRILDRESPDYAR